MSFDFKALSSKPTRVYDSLRRVQSIRFGGGVTSSLSAFGTSRRIVLALGPDCYKGERFQHSGPWCKVGDWVIIPRNEGTQFLYNEIPVHLLPDDRILTVIPDPTVVRRH